MSSQRSYSFSRQVLVNGIRDGIPIGLGYFAVSFSLGIAARKAGLSPFQGFLASLFNNASAGEYAAFTLIAANAGYLQVAIITLIANAPVSSDELCACPAFFTGHAVFPPFSHWLRCNG